MYINILNVMTENKDIEILLKNIQEGLKAYTLKELNNALVEALNKTHDKKDEIEFVLNSVMQHYNISSRVLKQSNARGIKQEYKQMAYCLLYFNLGLSIRYISSRIFFNWATGVLTGIKKYKNLNPELKQDKNFLETYKSLQKKLIKFITDKQNKQ